MKNLIEKENSIFEIIKEFLGNGLVFIVVGGYAVSSYKHRFSIDADLVIKENDLDKFTSLLQKKGFKKTISKELINIYGSKFVRYEKDLASIDFLVGALACRQTGASFGYDFLLENSSKRKIIGVEKEIFVFVPRREVLIIVKIHSARLTDLRDVAALAKDSSLEFIRKYLFRGDIEVVKENLKKLIETIEDEKFIDSFKGVFMEKKFDIDLEKLRKISLLKE